MFWWIRPAVLLASVLQFCESDIAYCPPEHCSLHGKCFWINGYKTCQCNPTYSGAHCENRRNKNDEVSNCRNGGVFLAGRCMCQDGFSGDFCERFVPRHDAYLRAGCRENPAFCAQRFGDGECEEACNDIGCFFDGFDCSRNTKKACKSDCASVYRDGTCNSECDGSECGFDGGDCVIRFYEEDPIVADIETDILGLCLNLRQMSVELAQVLHAPVQFKWATDGNLEIKFDDSKKNCFNLERQGSHSGNQTVKLYLYIDFKGCATRFLETQLPCFRDPLSAVAYIHNKQMSHDFKNDYLTRMRIEGSYVSESEKIRLSNILRIAAIFTIALSVFLGIFGFSELLRRKFCRHELFATIWKVPADFNMSTSSGNLPDKKIRQKTVNKNVTSRKRKHEDEERPYSICCPNEFSRHSDKSGDPLSNFTAYMEPPGYEPDLLHAARLNSPEMVQLLLSRGDRASCKDDDGNTALHHAVAINNFHIVKMLLDSYSCDLDAKNALGQTALMLALKLPEISNEDVRVLVDFTILERGKRTEIYERQSLSGPDVIIPYRSSYGRVTGKGVDFTDKTFRSNVTSGVDSFSLTDCFGRSVLHYAALNNRFQLIPILVAYGAEVNIKDDKGETPLHLAARSGLSDVVSTLISLGADASICDQLGHSALHVASKNGHFFVARFIESHCRKLQSKDTLAETNTPTCFIAYELYPSEPAQYLSL